MVGCDKKIENSNIYTEWQANKFLWISLKVQYDSSFSYEWAIEKLMYSI